MENKIGIEAEYILRNKKGEIIIPPVYFGRDGFPVLGEIRGEPGSNVEESVSNFIKAKIKTERLASKIDNVISFEPIARIPLKIYKKAMAIIRDNEEGKDALLSTIMNIYNIDISDYSDQIVENNKIQGCNASCGLHIHFSSNVSEERIITETKYEEISLPIKFLDGKAETSIELFKCDGYEEKERIRASVSQLNRPTVEWIVKQMDDRFFDKFAPPKNSRTKYRQPGFFELKEYGFEYRSIASTAKSISNIMEIVEFSFELLNGLKNFNYRKFE